MSTSVKYIHSGMRGAPQINGTAGTLIAALDALFSTGWGVTTAVSVTVASGIATATLISGQTFDIGAVVLIEGATPGDINGEARVLTSSLTSIAWETTAADGAATGTITIKYAPQTSWVKAFGATDKAVYQSNHVQSAGYFLRVDDTGTTAARVRGFETMTDVDTGTGPFPTDAQIAGGGYIHKSGAANTTGVGYRIFCDERFVIFSIAPAMTTSATYLAAPPRGFGDPITLAPSGDAWATLLSASGSSLTQSGTASLMRFDSAAAAGFSCAPRVFSGLGGSTFLQGVPYTGQSNGASGADPTMGVLPSEVDGQIKMSPVFYRDAGAGKPARVTVPGVFYIPQSDAANLLADGDTFLAGGDMAGRRMMVIADVTGTNPQTSASGRYLVDISGPWR